MTTFSHSVRRRGAEMGCFRGRGGVGNLLNKALSFVSLVVILWLLFMATSVTARLLANVPRSVSSAVQEPLLTDEVAALKEIASALNRNAELLSNNWSWIKVGLLSLGVLFAIEIMKIGTGIFTGVCTQRLVDQRKEAMADRPAQQTTALNRIATTTADADREEKLTNSEADRLEKELESVEPNRRDNLPYWPAVETETSTEKGKEALTEERDHYCCVRIEVVS